MIASLRLTATSLLCLLALVGCEPRTADHDPTRQSSDGNGGATSNSVHAAHDASDAATATRPAPWDDGWQREWFYPHPRDAGDARWDRLAKLVGRVAPPLEALSDWHNAQPTPLADLRGRAVLVKFWATWCSDCKASVSSTAATARRVGERLAILEVCAPKGGDAHAETVRRWGIELPTALDATGASEAAYEVPRWPYYVLIDSEGVVRATGVRTAHLDAAIDHLLELEATRPR